MKIIHNHTTWLKSLCIINKKKNKNDENERNKNVKKNIKKNQSEAQKKFKIQMKSLLM